jgi:hypothetical protein
MAAGVSIQLISLASRGKWQAVQSLQSKVSIQLISLASRGKNRKKKEFKSLKTKPQVSIQLISLASREQKHENYEDHDDRFPFN